MTRSGRHSSGGATPPAAARQSPGALSRAGSHSRLIDCLLPGLAMVLAPGAGVLRELLWLPSSYRPADACPTALPSGGQAVRRLEKEEAREAEVGKGRNGVGAGPRDLGEKGLESRRVSERTPPPTAVCDHLPL